MPLAPDYIPFLSILSFIFVIYYFPMFILLVVYSPFCATHIFILSYTGFKLRNFCFKKCTVINRLEIYDDLETVKNIFFN